MAWKEMVEKERIEVERTNKRRTLSLFLIMAGKRKTKPHKVYIINEITGVISRKEALRKGLRYYFTGKPCSRGHICNRLTCDACCRECAALHSPKTSAAQKKRNPGLVTSYGANRRAAKLRATPPWADMIAIARVYIECPEGYTVDHILPLQGDDVCGLHIPINLQYLTPSENSRKGNRIEEAYLN